VNKSNINVDSITTTTRETKIHIDNPVYGGHKIKGAKNVIHSINSAKDPSSCLVVIANFKVHSLIDAGAICSLINFKLFKQIQDKAKFFPNKLKLESVSGEPLQVTGTAQITIELAGKHFLVKFSIFRNMSRPMILGRDFLANNHITKSYKDNTIRVGEKYAQLVSDKDIAKVIRTKKNFYIQSWSCNIVCASIKDNSYFKTHEMIATSFTDTDILHAPNLQLVDSIIKLDSRQTFPVTIINLSKKGYILKRGYPVGRLITKEDHDSVQVIEKTSTINTDELN
jgi:hypothetical protein